MTPEEAAAAIRAGYAHRLMKDWFGSGPVEYEDAEVFQISPAIVGYEASPAPSTARIVALGKGPCTFLKDGLCEIHDSGFKPIQCRNAHHSKGTVEPSVEEMETIWNTDEGRAVVAEWAGSIS